MTDTKRALNKAEKILLKRLYTCRTKKCKDPTATKNQKKFQKNQSKACSQKNSKAFYKCSSKFYNESNYKKRVNNSRNCAKKKCAKEQTAYRKAFNKLLNLKLQIIKP
jgi:hypothetical protein